MGKLSRSRDEDVTVATVNDDQTVVSLRNGDSLSFYVDEEDPPQLRAYVLDENLSRPVLILRIGGRPTLYLSIPAASAIARALSDYRQGPANVTDHHYVTSEIAATCGECGRSFSEHTLDVAARV